MEMGFCPPNMKLGLTSSKPNMSYLLPPNCLPSFLLLKSSSLRLKTHFAVKPASRTIRCEFEGKVNGVLSGDSDPRFVDRVWSFGFFILFFCLLIEAVCL